MSEERFDPRRHTLEYAAHRLEVLSHKTPRVPAREPGTEEQCEPTTGELATGGVIEETFFLPRAVSGYGGDVPWASQPPPAPWRVIGDPVVVPPTILDEHRTPPEIAGRHGTVNVTPAPEPMAEERIRQIVTETMMRVLYPESNGAVTHEQRRVRQWNANGDEWRGVLYRVEREGE